MLTIPKGYALVPERLANLIFAQLEWESVTEPTIKQAADYVGVTVRQIKYDMEQPKCPLMKSREGGKGRGDEMRFFKKSVEHYKIWRNNGKRI